MSACPLVRNDSRFNEIFKSSRSMIGLLTQVIKQISYRERYEDSIRRVIAMLDSNYQLVPMATTYVQYIAILLLFLLGVVGPHLSVMKVGCCTPIERQSLLEIKKGLVDPSNLRYSWVSGELDCCRWAGVTCNNVTGYVEKLHLQNPYNSAVPAFSLGEEINPSLIHLQHLKYLNLSGNCFGRAKVPSFIASMKALVYLDLSTSCVLVKLPPLPGNFSKPRYPNSSVSTYPVIANDLQILSVLTSLRYLDMSGLDLSMVGDSLLHNLNMLPSLSSLYLSRCRLHKLPFQIPYTTTTNLTTSLSVLDLSNNYFDNSILHSLSKFQNLEVLDLSNNNFGGSIFKAFVNLTSLQVLNLKMNRLQGPIPETIGHMTALRILNLRENYVTGPLPDAFENITFLRILDLQTNYLDGAIPLSLGRLCMLKELYLSRNNIGGNLVEFMDGLASCEKNSIEIIESKYTKLTGHLPYSMESLTSLRILNLRNNKMNGTIPNSLGQLSELVQLDLSDNSWEGELSEAHLANLVKLEWLIISSGKRPKSLVFKVSSHWVAPFTGLSRIDLTNCQLGPLFPSWLRNQTLLYSLILNNVGISDAIPDWFTSTYPYLSILDLSNNQIKGKIPLEFHYIMNSSSSSTYLAGPSSFQVSRMSILHLGNNLFSGKIPSDMDKLMPYLTILQLQNNLLDGGIPSSMCKLSRLGILVLARNSFSGELAEGCWENLKFLQLMDLSNNALSGKIPNSFWSLPLLFLLSLNKNKFHGELPSTMRTSSPLRSIDLGENGLFGELPRWIGENLLNLQIFGLRSNSFRGIIPKQLCLLPQLRILDLSHNQLLGTIPPCFGNFNEMAKAGVTNPFITPFLSIDEPTFVGDVSIRIIKGIELEYNGSLSFQMSIDLSNNCLSGGIPMEITRLSGLGILNLSMNHLTGTIPEKIGNMQSLEVLDLRRNQLFGTIPSSISTLHSLSLLNLSYNNFSGRIPTGTQLQTLIDPSIYEGNPNLCGPPLKDCPSHEKPNISNRHQNKRSSLWASIEKSSFFISIVLGFIVGFWSVCGTLLLKRSWRHAYFRFVDNMRDRIFVFVLVEKAMLGRRLGLGRNTG